MIDYKSNMDRGVLLICLAYTAIIFSSPIPSAISWVEISMGCVLIAGALFMFPKGWTPDFSSAALIVCIALLVIIPLNVGLSGGSKVSDIARDVIPMAFQLFLPILFLSNSKKFNQTHAYIVLLSIIVVGATSSLCFIWGIHNLYGSFHNFLDAMNRGVSGSLPPTADALFASPAATLSLNEFLELQKFYFLKAYEPAVVFSAIFLLCVAAKSLLINRNILLGMLSLFGGILCFIPIATLGLRAYIFFVVMACAFYLYKLYATEKVYRKYSTGVIAVLGVIALSMVLYSTGILRILLLKQSLLGSNGKIDEWKAVLGVIQKDFHSLTFGIGWGGYLNNPDYPNHHSRFTHSIVSFYLLKSGLLGILLFIAISKKLFDIAASVYSQAASCRSLIITAASPTLLIGLMFQPTYKMLGFGIVLSLLLVSIGKRVETSEKNN